MTCALHVRVFFFFQAEDGIRDLTVTGVQTCALPIWAGRADSLAYTLQRVAGWLPAGQSLQAKEVTGTVRQGGRIGWLQWQSRSEEHTSELQSQSNLVCRLLLEKKKNEVRAQHQDTLRQAIVSHY